MGPSIYVCLGFTWTPKVCRIIAFYGFGAIILPTFGCLGRGKLEHGFRMISAGIPCALAQGHEDNDVPAFWLLLQYTLRP